MFTSSSGADSGWGGIILGDGSDYYGPSSLSYCVIEKAINGLTCINTQTLVSGSVIQQNGNYGMWINNTDLEIVKSKIINNRSCGIYNESYYGLLKIGGSPANSCQLYGNGTYECYNAGAESVMAYSNYWGTTDLALIDSRIYDYYDDNNWGIVHYTAIPLAVQLTSFTAVSAENGVVISWRTESESDCYQWSVERRPAGGIYQQIYSTGGQTNSATPRQYDHTDNSPLTGGDYEYLLTQTSSTGQTIHYGPVSISIAGKNPTSFALNGCYPNPASYRAAIDYQLPEQAQVTIKIYNALGQLVRTLVDETQPAGYYQRSWDGTGQQSNTVSSGTYIYRMEAGGGKYSKIKKMIWLK
ncbi:MAG: FlgD immunoglobulin-like domain containing protein [bacterium]|nr:FlgD immunoglobulin-like domain containing protein [bacterium]